MSFCAAVALYFGLRRENARRDQLYGHITATDTFAEGSEGGEKMADIRHDLDDQKYLERWGLTGMSKEEIIDLGDDVSSPPARRPGYAADRC